MNVFKSWPLKTKVRRLLSRPAPQPPAQPGALSAEPCRWLQSSSSSYLRYSSGHLEARTLASPALKEAKFFSFQKMDTSLYAAFISTQM